MILPCLKRHRVVQPLALPLTPSSASLCDPFLELSVTHCHIVPLSAFWIIMHISNSGTFYSLLSLLGISFHRYFHGYCLIALKSVFSHDYHTQDFPILPDIESLVTLSPLCSASFSFIVSDHPTCVFVCMYLLFVSYILTQSIQRQSLCLF